MILKNVEGKYHGQPFQCRSCQWSCWTFFHWDETYGGKGVVIHLLNLCSSVLDEHRRSDSRPGVFSAVERPPLYSASDHVGTQRVWTVGEGNKSLILLVVSPQCTSCPVTTVSCQVTLSSELLQFLPTAATIRQQWHAEYHVWCQASVPFFDNMHRRLVVPDASRQPVGPVFKGQAFFLRCLGL